MSHDIQSFLRLSVGAYQVNHNGKLYSFNRSEARAFEILLQAWKSDLPSVAGSFILDKLERESFSRLKQVFTHRRKSPKSVWVNEAWGTLIIGTPGKLGAYQLALDPGTVVDQLSEADLSPPTRSAPCSVTRVGGRTLPSSNGRLCRR